MFDASKLCRPFLVVAVFACDEYNLSYTPFLTRAPCARLPLVTELERYT
jgi:hypothetical protein